MKLLLLNVNLPHSMFTSGLTKDSDLAMKYTSSQPMLIDLSSKLPSALPTPLVGLMNRLLGIDMLNADYQRLCLDGQPDANFFKRCLQILGVTYNLGSDDYGRIPSSGPLLVVANHPSGGLEGIVAGAVLSAVRSDVRLLGNHLLGHIPEMRPWLIEVDPLARAQTQSRNRRSLKAALLHLRAGGCLLAFPAGSVAHWQWGEQRVCDPPWHASIARLALTAPTPVLPMFFSGRNSISFQICALLSRRARLLLLAREMMRCRGNQVSLRIGRSIGIAELQRAESAAALVNGLRNKTYALAGDQHPL